MIKEKTQGFSLKNFTCAVIGVGGLGCNIAVHLAGAGVGRLLLFDFDKISPSNLNRQFLYTKEDIGKEKAFTAKKHLSLYTDDTEIYAENIKITKDNIPEGLLGCDMIFLAADNEKARKIISDFAVKNKIPLVLGGIDGFFGTVYLYLPDITPCPFCAGVTEKGETHRNISAAAGIIGSLQSSVGIQYLITKDINLGGKLTVYDGDSFSSLKIISSKNCKICNTIRKEETI